MLPFGYAFAAGMVASVNPCGFLVLPSFGIYYLGLESQTGQHPWAPRLRRALVSGLAATCGFLVLFGAIGLTVSLLGRSLTAIFPWLSIAVGIGLGALGL